MDLRFEVITDVKKLDKETLFAFLNACSGKHTQALKYDYVERCKNIFNGQALDEMLTFYKRYDSIILKGKNSFWIHIASHHLQGVVYWRGEIKVKNLKKTDEIIVEIIDLFRPLSCNGQLLFGSISTQTEHTLKHEVVTKFASGGRSVGKKGMSIYDFKEYFPGIYWCTLFGKSMVEGVGKEHFSNIPNVEYLDFPDDTIAFRLTIPVTDENNELKLKAQSEIANHIGKDFFFDLYNENHKPSYPPLLKKRMEELENVREAILAYTEQLK